MLDQYLFEKTIYAYYDNYKMLINITKYQHKTIKTQITNILKYYKNKI